MVVYSSNVASILESLCFLNSWRADLLKQSSSLRPSRSNKIWSHSVVVVSLWYCVIEGQIRSWRSEPFFFHHEWAVLTFHLFVHLEEMFPPVTSLFPRLLLFFFGSHSAIIACLASFFCWFNHNFIRITISIEQDCGLMLFWLLWLCAMPKFRCRMFTIVFSDIVNTLPVIVLAKR